MDCGKTQDLAPKLTTPANISKRRRSGVSELTNALISAGVSADDIVIQRDPDGTVRVFKSPERVIIVNKLSSLDKWKLEHRDAS